MKKFACIFMICCQGLLYFSPAFADSLMHTNVGFPIGYAENFDQAVDKAKLTAVLSLLPDAKRDIYMKLGLAATGFSQDDIAALALGSMKIRTIDATTMITGNITVTVDATLSDDMYSLLLIDPRLLGADRQLLAEIRQTLENGDRLNRNWVTASENERTQISRELLINSAAAKTQYIFLEAFWDLAANANGDAVTEFDKILAADKSSANALLWRGVAYYYTDKYDLAVKDLTDATVYPETKKTAYYYLGNCYYVQNKYSSAIDSYDKVLAAGEPDARVYLYRGNCYRKSGKNDAAVSDYTQAIRLDDKLADAYIYRGDCYLYAGKYTDAAKDYDTVIRMNKADGYLYFNRGAIYLKNGDVDNAIDCFNKTTKLLPGYADGYYDKALAYDQKLYLERKNGASPDQGLVKRAVDAYKQFIQLADPKRPEVQKAQKRVKELSAITVLDI